jgi:Outer membrane receptor proteins, mostly Fe transport
LLIIGQKFSYISSILIIFDYDGLNNNQSALSGAMYNSLRQLPNTPIYDPKTPTGYNIFTQGTSSVVGPWKNNAIIANGISNIVYVLNNNMYTSNLTRFIGDVYAGVKITDWLKYRAQFGADNSITDGRLYWNKVHGDGFASGGIVEGNNLNMLRYNIQNMLTFDKAFGSHNLLLTLVQEFQHQRSNYIFGGGSGLADDYFGQGGPITNSYTVQTSGGSITESALASYIARFNYNFAKKYFLQASVRRDGLSQLPYANRWGTFPGVSVGWTVSNENFMQSIRPTLSDLKLRASYAKVGNTDIGNYPFMSLYGNARYGDATGLALIQGGNPDLKWETSVKYDYGVDFGFFNNRLTLSADYFINDQNDIILDRPVSPLLGIPNNNIRQNIGASKNSGIEFSANTDIIKKSDLVWNVGANVSFVKNEVTALVDGSDILYNIDSNRQQVGIIRIGESIRSLYGFEYWGVNPANGNPVYFKADGSLVQQDAMTGAYTTFNASNPGAAGSAASLVAADKKILGNTIPKYFGAFNTSVKYKNFDLGALVRFSGGNKILNLTRRDLLGMDFTNNSTEILNRWQSPSNPGDGWTPRVIAARSAYINMDGIATSRFVEDGSFVKIDNITLGYSLPKDLVQSIGMSQFRIFTTVQNAFIFTKYTGIDPELEINGVDFNTVPRQRTLSVGLNASF